MSQEARVGDDCDALLRPPVQPRQEFDGAGAAVLVALPLVLREEDVFVVLNFAEVKVLELRGDGGDGPPPVAPVVVEES